MSLILNPLLLASGSNPDNWTVDPRVLTTTPISGNWYIKNLSGFIDADIGVTEADTLTIDATKNINLVSDFFTNSSAIATRDRVVPYDACDVSVDIDPGASVSARSLILWDDTGNYAAFHEHGGGQWGYIYYGIFAFNGWTGTRFRLTYDGVDVRWYVDGVLKFTFPIGFNSTLQFGLASSYFDGVATGRVQYKNFTEVSL